MTAEREMMRATLAVADSPCRWYPDEVDQNIEAPYGVYTVVSGFNDRHLKGDASTRQRVIQVDVYAKDPKRADNIMEWAEAQMDAATMFGVVDVNVSGAPGRDVETRLYRTSLEFTIRYTK